ncbi:TNT domain-containing protein [Mucilaginibacter sp. SG564]|uniref:TNT domain-containing protein n=1 Tax=unclassified Mucilaginibacter TaxID=2617802 RepID=UPI00155764A0|nr:TNT domain-containing protein [Mucilaginibacter sp. SG564]NOW97099.1 hypothetical protein [Mucilaginibacter sp. SG564]
MKQIRLLLLAVFLMPFLAQAQVAKKHPAQQAKVPAKNAKVRGISYDDFVKSVSDFADSTKKPLADTAWMLWKQEKWAKLEQFFTANSLNGGWPPNRGAVDLKVITLPAGILIDRYGGYFDADSVFQDRGTFVSRTGVPFPKRALPDKTLNSPYRVYKIIKPIPNVRRGVIIPWFGKPGLGVQFETPYIINDLKKEGYIKEQKTK